MPSQSSFEGEEMLDQWMVMESPDFERVGGETESVSWKEREGRRERRRRRRRGIKGFICGRSGLGLVCCRRPCCRW